MVRTCLALVGAMVMLPIVPAFAAVSAAMRKECSGYEPNNNVNNNDFSNFGCE